MNYVAIDQFDTANGIGIGTVLWVSGCEHNCPQCHNPQTHDPNFGRRWTDRQLEFLLKTLEPDYITRLTISGGDPLYPTNRSEKGNLVIHGLSIRTSQDVRIDEVCGCISGWTIPYCSKKHQFRISWISQSTYHPLDSLNSNLSK